MYHFDLTDLLLFSSIADEQSITRGAERRCLSTSSASIRMKNLEQSLDVKLMTRTAHGIVLTEAGHTLNKHIKALDKSIEQMLLDIEPFAQNQQGSIRVAANYGAIMDYLPDDLTTFLADFPMVKVVLKHHPSREIPDHIVSGRADIGICVTDTKNPNLTFLPYHTDRLVVITPLDHPLSKHTYISFKQTLCHSFLALTSDSAMQQFVFSKAREAGYPINPRVQVHNQETLIKLVQAGLGIAIVSKKALKRTDARVHICELTNAWAERNLQLLYPSDPQRVTPTLKKLLKHIKSGALPVH